jgi:hypothetical protein
MVDICGTQGSGYKCDRVASPGEYFRIVEIIPCGLNYFSENLVAISN